MRIGRMRGGQRRGLPSHRRLIATATVVAAATIPLSVPSTWVAHATGVPRLAVKTPVAAPVLPLAIFAHRCIVWTRGLCTAPPAPMIDTPQINQTASQPYHAPECQGDTNDTNCSGYDPYDEGCDGDMTPVGDSGRIYNDDNRENELVQYWSWACQSDFAYYMDWTQCYQYNNNACDWAQVWEDYGSSGKDSRSYFEMNPGVGAYGNLLYGGCGTQPTAAQTYVVDYFSGRYEFAYTTEYSPASC